MAIFASGLYGTDVLAYCSRILFARVRRSALQSPRYSNINASEAIDVVLIKQRQGRGVCGKEELLFILFSGRRCQPGTDRQLHTVAEADYDGVEGPEELASHCKSTRVINVELLYLQNQQHLSF